MPYLNFNTVRPATKLVIIFFSIITFGIIVFFTGILIGKIVLGMHLDQVNDVLYGRYQLLTDWQLKFFQALQTIGFFIIPGIFLKWLFSSESEHYFNTSGKPGFRKIIFLLVLFIAGGPFINWLVELNQNISLPDSLSTMESNLRSVEDLYAQLSHRLLNANTLGVYFINILLIAILPAIGEELIFRGVFQKLFFEITHNIHVAVLITAILFSAIHGQFFGFLPRFFLGLMFGYLMVWSNTIWLPIAAHFINNALVVTAFFLGNRFNLNLSLESTGININYGIVLAVSACFIGTMLYMIRKYNPLNR